MIHYSDVYEEVIQKNNMKDYAVEHAEYIYLYGPHVLVFYEEDQENNRVWLTLDFQEDFQTPTFLVSDAMDEDLMFYSDFESAMKDFNERVEDLKNKEEIKMKKILIILEGGNVQNVLVEGQEHTVQIIDYDKDVADDERYEFYGDPAYYYAETVSEPYTKEKQKIIEGFKLESEKRLNKND